jgi:hypothetical protein
MERRWCEKLLQAMLRVDKRKRNASIRAMERAAKRQCKKDERQSRADGGAAHQGARLECSYVRLQARGFGDVQGGAGGGVPEGRVRCREEDGREAALARVPAQGHSRLGAPRGAPEAVGQRGAKAGEFMVEREAEHENEILTDDEEE